MVIVSSSVLVLSVVKELDLSPDKISSIADRNSWLNNVLVKWSWGWTLSCLLPTVFISTYHCSRWCRLLHLSRLAVAHCVWYTTTTMFVKLDDKIGSCSDDSSLTRRQCVQNNASWSGFDISGHIFLLSYCVYILTEETTALCRLTSCDARQLTSSSCNNSWSRTMAFSLQIYAGLQMLVWIFMILVTSLYHHTLLEKIFGEVFAILVWYISYICLYGSMPYLPPKPYTKSSLN